MTEPRPPRRRWAMGCAVGCGLLLTLALVGAIVTGLWVRRALQGIEKADETYKTLVAEMGDVDAYAPPPDGVPAEDRWEVFLEVREETASAREAAGATIDRIRPSLATVEGVAGTIHVALTLFQELVASMSAYVVARDEALLTQRMGPGEYVYLYTLAYYSVLGHRPADTIAPPGEPGEGRVDVDLFGKDDALFGEAAVRRRYRRYALGMLQRQVASLGPDEDGLRATLEQEIHQMEVDPGRLVWQDGVPPAIAASIEPFRDRLETHYDPVTNRIELPLAEHEIP